MIILIGKNQRKKILNKITSQWRFYLYLCDTMNRIFQLNDDDYNFPSASLANKDGLLAFGGDLQPDRLIVAYANGIFPWYSEGEPLLSVQATRVPETEHLLAEVPAYPSRFLVLESDAPILCHLGEHLFLAFPGA